MGTLGITCIGLLACSLLLQEALTAEWDYTGADGPENWSASYPMCGLARQSPINIYEGDVTFNSGLQPFTFTNYDTPTGVTLTLSNNGHTAKVAIGGTTEITIANGGLQGQGPFKAAQFHFHWGSDSSMGSEHLISSHSFPMEVHVVHYNTKYPSVSDAVNKSDGLAVLGFMFEISSVDNVEYDEIVVTLANVQAKGASAPLTPVALNTLLPTTFGQFYRYQGSLTTPGCQQSVQWTVFKEPIKISERQLDAFRSLRDIKDYPIVDNFRPVQPINDRVMEANFDPDIHWGYDHGAAEMWGARYSKCDGASQSPVNIPSARTQLDANLTTPQFISYDVTDGVTMTLMNNGHSVKVTVDGGDIAITNMPGTYTLKQFHFHWGSSEIRGSEHTVDSKAYPMELHLVHYDKSKGPITTVLALPKGLAVLGFFFEISEDDNPNLKPIINLLPNIRNPGSSTPMPAINLQGLLPDAKNFYRYLGSLTTPGCYESVIWTVYTETIPISVAQLEAFRALLSEEKSSRGQNLPMVDNFRPVQGLNTRQISRSFALPTPAPKQKWSFEGKYGVNAWGNYFPACKDTPSSRQSPIDIPTDKATNKKTEEFTMIGYDSTVGVEMEIKNNGHAAQVNILAGDIQISGGGLQGTYTAAQFHFHWGADSTRGSEHLMSGRAYPMELHIVHYNNIYPDLGTAVSQPNGLAVFGFMFEVSSRDNANYNSLIAALSNVVDPDSKYSMQAVPLSSLIATDLTDFYRYKGSLTTPGCYESVTWTVFKSTVQISERQLSAFRGLISSDKSVTGDVMSLMDNYRPVQPLHYRTVTHYTPSKPVKPKPSWSYIGSKGPDQWRVDYPACEATPSSRQSPIDFTLTSVVYDEMDPFVLSNYNSAEGVTMEIMNNGHSIKCIIVSGDIQISGGALSSGYKAAQFHFHWGSDNSKGSEHLIDGQAYPMELHIVHYNTIYPNLGAAVAQSNGLAVLGFMFEVSAEANPNFDQIVELLADIHEPGTQVTMQPMALISLLPENLDEFFRYEGSLTTPGCHESVTWTVFKSTIKISEEQLQKFRGLRSSDISPVTGHLAPMVDNFRPPQPVNTRVVRANFYVTTSSKDDSNRVRAVAGVVALCVFVIRMFL